jgi:hypothetical protein
MSAANARRSVNGTKCMSMDRRRGRPALWDPLRDDRDYFALKVMLWRAEEMPLKPYALARAALALVRVLFYLDSKLSVAEFRGFLLDAANEETRERWRQMGKQAREPLIDFDCSPYRYGDDLIHIKRLGYKFQSLLIEAEVSLFFKDFPDGNSDDFATYCRSEEEKRQEALMIITRLMDKQLDSDTEHAFA